MKNTILLSSLFLGALVFMSLSVNPAYAAAFAKYDGVDGESMNSNTDTENEGTFVLQPPKEASSSSQDTSVPPWIKTSMTYWVEGHTSDAEFLSAVEYLANEKIIRVTEPTSTTGSFDTEMVSLGAHAGSNTSGTWDTEILSMDLTRHDSFFDVFTELKESTDSFFDVFFDVATESSQNTEDIDELERKIAALERKIAALETGSTSGNVETEFKVEKGE